MARPSLTGPLAVGIGSADVGSARRSWVLGLEAGQPSKTLRCWVLGIRGVSSLGSWALGSCVSGLFRA
eukprot:5354289-Prymnesium_polylepis.1